MDGDWDDASEEELRQLYAAIMLAPTLAVCEALLRGEDVPPERLDPEWAERYGVL
jgi:hypothetical protein